MNKKRITAGLPRITPGLAVKLVLLGISISSIFLLRDGFTSAAGQQEQSRPHIGRSYKDSKPAWEIPPQAHRGAPNVIYLVLDDVGYAQLGC